MSSQVDDSICVMVFQYAIVLIVFSENQRPTDFPAIFNLVQQGPIPGRTVIDISG
ncbi:Uncharacterised protein [Klebsiella pneumoniae]|nr:Uncharacterised protein [Klebsiella pneumoniae]